MSAAGDDDEIEASRAPLLDHLNELRTRLFIAVAALLVCFLIAYPFSKQLWQILTEPFVQALIQLRGADAARQGIVMQNTSAFGFFLVQLKVSLFVAIIASFPVTAYQAYAFIAPGLYKREKQAVTPFLIAAPVMFVLGCLFVYYVAMPFALEFALKQEVLDGPVQVKFVPKVEEYLALVTTLSLAFGFVFQIPVVSALLARSGVLSADIMRKGRRYAIVGIAAFSACVTPPDPLSMMIMAIPVYMLYEISIWIVVLIGRKRLQDEAKAAEEAGQPSAAE
ncbi:MAG: twin-arginine translocase subunit TatC [Caulobacterales bacterium]|jgi:sec-independent protein translocase protein TatC